MIEVVVSRLGLDSTNQSYVVILQEKGGQRLLPIWIGQAEAESIMIQMHNLKRPRPLTHDLCKSIILGLGGQVQRVQITHVEKNTYYAELHIARDGDVVKLDARPSDSIAIALRHSAPIFADEALLTDVQVEEQGAEPFVTDSLRSEAELNAEQLKEYLERLRPEDFGKFNL
ncbi:MAG TPA: bifunctional nuclease family protein [Gemmatimonadaceae bacterium]|nr:bifunctional nuclease family protein [Gemmatimonadaceae bacterium]